MRNLQQYPVTDAEIIAFLTELKEKIVDPAPGDLGPTLVDAAIERVKALAEIYQAIHDPENFNAL